MRIEKWYLDCVTPTGAGIIGYSARVSAGPLAVRLSETVQWPADEAVRHQCTALGGALPVESADGLAWNNVAVAAQGTWQPIRSGIPTEILHEESAGRIEWTCLYPAARASVSAGSTQYDGLGYAERLVLTLSLTRLPLRELHWGRFITETQSFVWIRWRGPVERSWCFHNGQAVVATQLGRTVSWPGHTLELAPGVILRSGPISYNPSRQNRWVHQLMPSVIRRLDETKWCSAGTLTDATGLEHSGWAIHEVVIFP
ncbi:MAG: hypothetical protein WCR49_11655 [Opitutae bacterium]